MTGRTRASYVLSRGMIHDLEGGAPPPPFRQAAALIRRPPDALQSSAALETLCLPPDFRLSETDDSLSLWSVRVVYDKNVPREPVSHSPSLGITAFLKRIVKRKTFFS